MCILPFDTLLTWSSKHWHLRPAPTWTAVHATNAPTGSHRKEAFFPIREALIARDGAHVCLHRGAGEKETDVLLRILWMQGIMHADAAPTPSLTSHGESTWRTLGPIGKLQDRLSTRWCRSWRQLEGEEVGWWLFLKEVLCSRWSCWLCWAAMMGTDWDRLRVRRPGVGARDRKAATGQFRETMSHTFAFGSCL